MLIIVVSAAIVTVLLVKRKTITLVLNGKPEKIVTYKNTVEQAFTEMNISVHKKDKISVKLNSKLVNKETITLKQAVPVNLVVGGNEIPIDSAEDNVDSLLKTEGITLNDLDKLTPSKDTKLSKGLKVEVVRVAVKTFTDTTSIDFDTTVKTDRSIANTERIVVQDGEKGEHQTTTEVTYENDKEVSRKVTSDIVAKAPVEKVIVQGTYPVMPISRGGDKVPYSKVLNMRATAYSGTRGKTYTASGRAAVRDIDGYSTIAVDPSVIPYGTKLFIPDYGFAIAADTGTAIVGNTIDVYFESYSEACSWAVKNVKVYILD